MESSSLSFTESVVRQVVPCQNISLDVDSRKWPRNLQKKTLCCYHFVLETEGKKPEITMRLRTRAELGKYQFDKFKAQIQKK
jgi:hypothetical protein